MHSASFDLKSGNVDGGDVLVAIAALVIEGRTPRPVDKTCLGFYEGPHCYLSHASQGHQCDMNDAVCLKYNNVRSQVLAYWEKSVPICIEVLVNFKCRQCKKIDDSSPAKLVEQWYLNIAQRRTHIDHTTGNVMFNTSLLIGAIKSQLHFSQISSWLSKKDTNAPNEPPFSIIYRLTVPGETYGTCTFSSTAQTHNFPVVEICSGVTVNISLLTLPRTQEIPQLQMCSNCQKQNNVDDTDSTATNLNLFDDRMHTRCTLKGKHHCTDEELLDSPSTSDGYTIKMNCSQCQQSQLNHTKSDCLKLNCQQQQQLSDLQPSCSSNTASQNKDVYSLNCKCQKRSQPTNKNSTNSSHDFFHNALLNCQQQVPNSQPTTSKVQKVCLLKGKHQCNSDCSEKIERRKPQLRLDISKATNSADVDLELSDKELNEVLCVLQQQPYHGKKLYQNQDDLKRGGSDFCAKDNVSSCSSSTSSTCKGDILLSAILRSCSNSNNNNNNNTESKCFDVRGDMYMKCDMNVNKSSDNNLISIKDNIYVDIQCDKSATAARRIDRHKISRKITFEDDCSSNAMDNSSSLLSCCKRNVNDANDAFSHSPLASPQNDQGAEESGDDMMCCSNTGIPSALEKAKFKKNLDNAASMVFHTRTGLPLTSSPAPIRKGKSCFDFDSSINSVSAIRSALFSLGVDEDSESDCSIVSPCSPDYSTSSSSPSEGNNLNNNRYHRRGQAGNLLGSFEESVLNGRLKPDSTVHGFTAELGASGSFVPRHLVVPVTVFFYTLGDMSSPYLGHINLGKKGYNVPKTGTVQVTLFNPLRTVVKMFVIMFDLSDMPANSQTFIRQRTLYMPINCQEANIEWGQKWLRYLIHLRFTSSKSGRIYLHSDIRMIIFRKSDLDTATAHGIDMSYELRSFTHTPSNPKYSPRK